MTNQQVQRAIELELAAEAGLDHSHVAVKVNEGVAVLSGTVPSYPESRAAEAAALRIPDVCGVANELAVELSLHSRRTDQDLAALASAILAQTVHVPHGVRPVVEHGYITLTGEAEWHYQRAAAERAVAFLKGVRGIHNEIRLRSRGQETSVKDGYLAALEASSISDASRIHLDTSDGVLVLTGCVGSCADRDEAVRLAWNTPGVREVECRLNVGPAPAREIATV